MSRSSQAVTLDEDSLSTKPVTADTATEWIERGSPQFMRVTLALFSAGLATFALLYCVQPILPVLSQQFGVTPAESSISLSLSTGLMALGLLFTRPAVRCDWA